MRTIGTVSLFGDFARVLAFAMAVGKRLSAIYDYVTPARARSAAVETGFRWRMIGW
jgi:hypothetical protein